MPARSFFSRGLRRGRRFFFSVIEFALRFGELLRQDCDLAIGCVALLFGDGELAF